MKIPAKIDETILRNNIKNALDRAGKNMRIPLVVKEEMLTRSIERAINKVDASKLNTIFKKAAEGLDINENLEKSTKASRSRGGKNKPNTVDSTRAS